MRASLAEQSVDRISRCAILIAAILCGVLVFFVALPLASSSPYPTPSRQEWAIYQSPMQMSLASASSVPAVLTIPPPSGATVRTISIKRTAESEVQPPPQPKIVTASLGGLPTSEPAYRAPASTAPVSEETIPVEDAEAATPKESARVPPRPRRDRTMDEVDAYLWSVYQRQPTKRDSTGDFTWKDPAAAKRVGKTLQAYVIMGMDPDLREALYHAGKAMDAEGIAWTIVSGFRDDYRQSIAAGIKARTGFSRHGGSRATGGYGHGMAVDLAHVDGPKRHNEVWSWLDRHGMRYGLSRPIRHFDPPHVEPRGDWRRIAAKLRTERTGTAVAEREPVQATPAKAKSSRYQRRAGRSRRS